MKTSKMRRKLTRPICNWILGVGMSYGISASAAPIELKTFPTHSRMEFELDAGAQAAWKDLPGGFELSFPSVGLADLGAPLGSERDWSLMLQRQLRDYRVESVALSEEKGGVVIRGKWKFPTGAQALADPKMEKFSYHDRAPARFVVDFWVKQGPTVAEAVVIRERKKREEGRKLAALRAKRRQQRAIASKKLENFEELTEFCRKPFSEDTEVFLPFRAAREKLDLSRYFPQPNPDDHFKYSELKAASANEKEDLKFVRLALSLYREGKYALSIKTLDFFDAEQPRSQYRQEMKFLRANAMLRLGMGEAAVRILRGLSKEEANLEGKARTAVQIASAYVAWQQFEKGDVLSALESFLELTRRFPEEKLSWVYHLGAAEALFMLGQTERAASEYAWVTTNGPDAQAKSAAAFRVGDLYLARLQYERAMAAYFESMTRFPEEAKKFPPVYLNRAESLYWLGQLDSAKKEFENFLRLFPVHPEGWRATLRMAEIVGRQSGENDSLAARKWFLETVDRYPYSTGAIISRARLIPCGDHGGFSAAMASHFFEKDVPPLNESKDLSAAQIQQFIVLQRVRSLIAFEQNHQAIALVLSVMESGSPSETLKKSYQQIFWALLRKSSIKMLAEGKRYEALNFYHRTMAVVPQVLISKRPSENDYLWKLSEAAAELGFSRMALEIAKQAQENRSIAAIADKDLEKIDKDIKVSSEAFVKAKALWLQAGDKKLDDIKSNLDKIISESSFSYEKEILLGLMDELNEKNASALGHALRAKLLNPDPSAKLNDDALRIDAWISRLQASAGRSSEAIDGYRKLRTFEKNKNWVQGSAAVLGLSGIGDPEEWVVAEGDLLGRNGKWGEAAQAYSGAVKDGLGGNRVLYHYALALLKTGSRPDRELAIQTLEKITKSTDSGDGFWKKLASEALAKR